MSNFNYLHNVNYRGIELSRYYADCPVIVELLYKYKKDGDIIKLQIGKRRVIELPNVIADSIKIMVSEWLTEPGIERMYKGSIISLDDVELTDGVIDIAAYTDSKGYKCNQLDSKEYTRRKRKSIEEKNYDLRSFGIYYASRTWMDINVYEVDYSFLPNYLKIGENDLKGLSIESFDSNIIDEELFNVSKEITLEGFQKYFKKVMPVNHMTIITTHGRMKVGSGWYEPKFWISLWYEDGCYHYIYPECAGERRDLSEDEINKLTTFAYSLARCTSKKECDNVEAKAKLIGMML